MQNEDDIRRAVALAVTKGFLIGLEIAPQLLCSDADALDTKRDNAIAAAIAAVMLTFAPPVGVDG